MAYDGRLVQHQSRVKRLAHLYEMSTSKEYALIDDLTKENECLRVQCKDLRRERERDIRQLNDEWNQRSERKLDELRRRLSAEKTRDLHTQRVQLIREFEDRLAAAVEVKDREQRFLATQLAKMKEQSGRSRSKHSMADSVDSGSVRCFRSQSADCEHRLACQKLRSDVTDLKKQIASYQQTLMECRMEGDRVREIHQRELQQVVVQSKKNTRGLIEELRGKERQVGRLEQSFRQLQAQFLSRPSGRDAENIGITKSSKGQHMIPKDDYDKEKQQLESIVQEAERQLSAIQSQNYDLTAENAELVEKLKSTEDQMERLKKSAERSRQLSEEKQKLDEQMKQLRIEYANMEKYVMESHLQPDGKKELERIRQHSVEQAKTIAALKQSAIEKDRRMDLLQHKLRRMRRSTVNDTIDETESVESETSHSTNSLDTILEDWEELAREELEENYRRLAQEHLELQRSFTILHRSLNDPAWLDDKMKSLHAADTHGRSATPRHDETYRLQNRLSQLENQCRDAECAAEKARQELYEVQEQRELLEFQLLEIHHGATPSSLKPSCKAKVCDRGVSTSDDEAYFSVDERSSVEFQEDCELYERVIPLDELKIRLTLLKHRKELRPDDKRTVAQAKQLWDSLQKEHEICEQKLATQKEEYDQLINTLQDQLVQAKNQGAQKSPKKQSAWLKEDRNAKQPHEEVLSHQECQIERDKWKQEAEKLRYMLHVTEESEKRQKANIEDLRKQTDTLKCGREAETYLLQKALDQRVEEVENYRRRLDTAENDVLRLEKDCVQARKSLADVEEVVKRLEDEVDKHKGLCADLTVRQDQRVQDEAELTRLHVLVEQYQDQVESQSAHQKDVTCKLATVVEENENLAKQLAAAKNLHSDHEKLCSKYEHLSAKCQEYKNKYRESRKLLSEYEDTGAKSEERLRQLLERSREQNARVTDLMSQLSDAQQIAQSAVAERDDLTNDLRAMRQENKKLAAMLRNLQAADEQDMSSFTEILEENRKLRRDLDLAKNGDTNNHSFSGTDQALANRATELEAECAELRRRTMESVSEGKMMEQLMQANRNVDCFKALIKEQANKLAEKQRSEAHLEEQVKVAEFAVVDANRRLSTVTQERDRLMAQLDRISHESLQQPLWDTDHAGLVQKIQILECTVESLHRKLEEQATAAHQLEQLEIYNKQLESQFEVQIKTVQFLKDQIIALQRDLDARRLELTAVQDEKLNLQKRYEESCSTLEVANSSQRNFHTDMAEHIVDLGCTMDKLRHQLQEKEAEISALRAGGDSDEHMQRLAKVNTSFETLMLKLSDMTVTSRVQLQREFMDIVDAYRMLQEDVELQVVADDLATDLCARRLAVVKACSDRCQVAAGIVKLLQTRRRASRQDSYQSTDDSGYGHAEYSYRAPAASTSQSFSNLAKSSRNNASFGVHETCDATTLTDNESSDFGLEISADWHNTSNIEQSCSKALLHSTHAGSALMTDRQKDMVVRRLLQTIRRTCEISDTALDEVEMKIYSLLQSQGDAVYESPVEWSATESDDQHRDSDTPSSPSSSPTTLLRSRLSGQCSTDGGCNGTIHNNLLTRSSSVPCCNGVILVDDEMVIRV